MPFGDRRHLRPHPLHHMNPHSTIPKTQSRRHASLRRAFLQRSSGHSTFSFLRGKSAPLHFFLSPFQIPPQKKVPEKGKATFQRNISQALEHRDIDDPEKENKRGGYPENKLQNSHHNSSGKTIQEAFISDLFVFFVTCRQIQHHLLFFSDRTNKHQISRKICQIILLSNHSLTCLNVV